MPQPVRLAAPAVLIAVILVAALALLLFIPNRQTDSINRDKAREAAIGRFLEVRGREGALGPFKLKAKLRR